MKSVLRFVGRGSVETAVEHLMAALSSSPRAGFQLTRKAEGVFEVGGSLPEDWRGLVPAEWEHSTAAALDCAPPALDLAKVKARLGR